MNISIFGGAFDPPHLGHLQVANYLIKQKLADQVWFVPVYTHPWAKRLGKEVMAPYKHRIAMLKLAISNPGVALKIAHYKKTSYTYPTMKHFMKKFPQHHFSWVMGSEYLPTFKDFLEGHNKLQTIPMFIYPRKNFPLKPLCPNMTPLSNAPAISSSSTLIRKKITAGQPLTKHVGPQIAKYITTHKLYPTTNQ